jgi:hypothetical protein
MQKPSYFIHLYASFIKFCKEKNVQSMSAFKIFSQLSCIVEQTPDIETQTFRIAQNGNQIINYEELKKEKRNEGGGRLKRKGRKDE